MAIVYIGTLTPERAKQGVYVCSLDRQTGSLSVIQHVTGAANPSYLATHPAGHRLYAASRGGGDSREAEGALIGYDIDAGSGRLSELNRVAVSPEPSYVTLDSKGRFAFFSATFSGRAGAAPIGQDGRLGPARVVHHPGASLIDQGRGKGDPFAAGPWPAGTPFPHSIRISPDDRFAFVPDVGLNRVAIYQFDAATGAMTPADPPWVEGAPIGDHRMREGHWAAPTGAGPRHMDFHPNGRWAYVVNESGSSVSLFDYDATHGRLRMVQTAGMLPADFSGNSIASDIRVHPQGRVLYASNRGYDSIATFAIDPADGRLTRIALTPTLGKHPRGFALSPDGGLLLVGNLESDTVAAFRIDPATGAPDAAGVTSEIPAPACIVFAQAGTAP